MLKLTYSNLEFQNFPGGTPGPPLQGEEREGEGEGRGKGREEGRGRIGRGGEGREGTGEGGKERGWWGGEGRGARHGLRPSRDKLWIRPLDTQEAGLHAFPRFNAHRDGIGPGNGVPYELTVCCSVDTATDPSPKLWRVSK